MSLIPALFSYSVDKIYPLIVDETGIHFANWLVMLVELLYSFLVLKRSPPNWTLAPIVMVRVLSQY